MLGVMLYPYCEVYFSALELCCYGLTYLYFVLTVYGCDACGYVEVFAVERFYFYVYFLVVVVYYGLSVACH